MTIADELRNQTALLSVQTAAKYIGVAYITAHRMGRQGRMPTIRVGSRVRVDPRALADWLEARSLKCA